MTVKVLVHASDPVNRAGARALLRPAREVDLLTEDEPADVVVLVENTVIRPCLEQLDRLRGRARCVVVTEQLAEQDMMTAIRCGVMSVLPLAGLTPTRLISATVGAVHGRSLLPPDLQAALLTQLIDMQQEILAPNGITLSGLDVRELDVLGLIAEGFRTEEIASKLSYSEGTVKSILHGAMSRLGLANRAHAVAHALRAGALP